MAENSGIEWTHHTFNPWIGCTKISPACIHCYAEAQDRHRKWTDEGWGPKAPRKRTSIANWRKPLQWNRQARAEGKRYRVFCASLADIFDNHKSILPEWRRDLWDLIEKTHHLDWLLLTKRPQNIKTMLPHRWQVSPRPNVWLGTTVENQEEADRRIPVLLDAPAVVRFLSCEPLLGPVDITTWLQDGLQCTNCGDSGYLPSARCCASPNWLPGLSISWVITGGESGPNFRPADPAWFRSLRDQCAAAGVPFLFKQWEGKTQKQIKALGRELDGVVHDGYPGTAA